MYAAYHNHPEVAQAFVDAGCELDAIGSVSLHKSYIFNKFGVVKYIIIILYYDYDYFARDSLIVPCTPVSAIFVFASKIDNATIVMLHCIFGVMFTHSPYLDLQESL